jgi:hypothetical protein
VNFIKPTPNRTPAAILAAIGSSLFVLLCLSGSLTLLSAGRGRSAPEGRPPLMSVCVAAALRPEPRLAVSWLAPHYGGTGGTTQVRAYPNILCARTPWIRGARSSGLLVLPPQSTPTHPGWHP